MNYYGLGSAGIYNLGNLIIHVRTWDTTNNIAEIHAHVFNHFFKNSMAVDMSNANTVDEYLTAQVRYFLFVSSKQALVTLDNHIHAKRIRKLLDKRVEAVEVMTLGKFENEEDHPYREFLSITDREYHRTDQAKRSPRTLAVITYPDNMELNDILNKFKPKKILHDNVLE